MRSVGGMGVHALMNKRGGGSGGGRISSGREGRTGGRISSARALEASYVQANMLMAIERQGRR